MKTCFPVLSIAALLASPLACWAQEEKEPAGGRRPNAQRPNPQRQAGQRPGPLLLLGGPGAAGGPGLAMLKMLPLMVALDTDEDGVISTSEIENAPKSLLKLDKDGDGKLSEEELKPDLSKMPMPGGLAGGPGMQGPPTGAMMARMFEMRDADKDGKLTGDEIPERMRDRVNMIDTDGDGSIDKSELEAATERLMGAMGGRPERGRNNNDGGGVKPKRPAE